MGTTTNLGIPYPENNDFVADGATNMKDIADAVDAYGGAWTTFTPQLWQNVNVNSTVNYAKYRKIGKTVFVVMQITATGAGGGGDVQIRNLPFTAANTAGLVGVGGYLDAGTANYNLTAFGLTTTSVGMFGWNQGSAFGTAPAVTIANNDIIRLSLVYEVA